MHCLLMLSSGQQVGPEEADGASAAAAVPCGREKTCEELMASTGAVFIHPYNDPRVIAGQGTIALELLEQVN